MRDIEVIYMRKIENLRKHSCVFQVPSGQYCKSGMSEKGK